VCHCSTVTAPGIFRVHKHLAAFSASIMQKHSPTAEEEYDFLNLARPCVYYVAAGYRAGLVRCAPSR
jgi:hypothetical protein